MGSRTSCQVSSPAMARLSSMVAVLKPFSSRYALSALRSELVSSPVSVRILQKSSSSRKIRFSMEGDSQVCICYKDLDQFRPVSLCGAYHRPSSERKPRPKSGGQRSIFEIADNRRTEPQAGVAHFDRQSSTNRSPGIDRAPYAEARKTTWSYTRNRPRVAPWADVLQAHRRKMEQVLAGGYGRLRVENLLRWSYY